MALLYDVAGSPRFVPERGLGELGRIPDHRPEHRQLPLFNSHLFDFLEGWIYVLGIGVLGGMVLREEPHRMIQTDAKDSAG